MRPLLVLLQSVALLPVPLAELHAGRHVRQWAREHKLFVAYVVFVTVEMVSMRILAYYPAFIIFDGLISDNKMSMSMFALLVIAVSNFGWSFTSWSFTVLLTSSVQRFLRHFQSRLSVDSRDEEPQFASVRRVVRRASLASVGAVSLMVAGYATFFGVTYGPSIVSTWVDETHPNASVTTMLGDVESAPGRFFGAAFHFWLALHVALDFAVIYSPLCVYCVVCLTIAERFQQLTDRLRRPVTDLEPLRMRHGELCALTQDADDVFMPLTVAALIFEVLSGVSTAFCLFYIDDKNVPFADVSKVKSEASVMLGRVMSCFFLRTAAAVRLHEQAHDLVKPLNAISFSSLSKVDRDQVQVMLHKLNGPPIGMTVAKFFVITRSFILTVFGLFVTYIILLVQFQEGGYSQVGRIGR